MRLIFAGTPVFAARALAALHAAGHEIALVLTQPDRPAGRGMASQASAVKAFALEHALPVYQPASLKTPDVHLPLRNAYADAMVVAAYGLIIPQPVLEIPRLGAINIHASLLPRWRGAAPIQRAMLAGDSETGICIMKMEVGLDTGPVLLEARIPIAANDTAGSLHDRLASLGAELIVSTLDRLDRDELVAQPQDNANATYAHKIEKAEAVLDWTRPAEELDVRIRAFNPYPGCHVNAGETTLKIWQAHVVSGDASAIPGTVLRADANGIVVACGNNALSIIELQKAGGKRLPAKMFLAGFPLVPGDRLQ